MKRDLPFLIINGITYKVLKTIDVGIFANAVAVNPNTKMIYVASQAPIKDKTGHISKFGYQSLFVINGKTYAVEKVIRTIITITNIAIDVKTNRIYLFGLLGGAVIRMNGNTNELVDDVSKKPPYILAGGGNFALNPNTNLLYVSNSMGNTISVINGSQNKIVTNSLFLLGLCWCRS